MSNFSINDMITINTPEHKEWHGRRGKICEIKNNGSYHITVVDNNGKPFRVNILGEQMVKVVKDPGLLKFINETLPKLTNAEIPEYNTDQEVPIDQNLSPGVQLYQAGHRDGYIKGFNEGYAIGYGAACKDINELFIKNAIVQPKPDDTN